MKKSVLKAVGKYIVCTTMGDGMIGKVLGVDGDMLKLRHFCCNNKWRTTIFHHSWIQNVRVINKEELKHFVDTATKYNNKQRALAKVAQKEARQYRKEVEKNIKEQQKTKGGAQC